MEYKELVKHHTQLIKDQNDNKWEVVETSDLEEICEAYHQSKLNLSSVVVSELDIKYTELCQCKQPKMCSVYEIDRNRCKNCKSPLWHD